VIIPDWEGELNLLNIRGRGILDKALSIFIIVMILSALGMLSYVVATAGRVPEKCTEFYILGVEGKAKDYPVELRVGEEGRVIVGMVNREKEKMSYRVDIAIDGTVNREIVPITLEQGGKWEGRVSFVPTKAGDNQKVEFLLYKEGESSPKEQLHLWINVKE